MCHQEPFPASYAQAFACLWGLVSPQHTHEPRYAMTPHFTPLELEFIPYAGGAWGIPDGCSPRARQPACSPGFFFSVRLWPKAFFMALRGPSREIPRFL